MLAHAASVSAGVVRREKREGRALWANRFVAPALLGGSARPLSGRKVRDGSHLVSRLRQNTFRRDRGPTHAVAVEDIPMVACRGRFVAFEIGLVAFALGRAALAQEPAAPPVPADETTAPPETSPEPVPQPPPHPKPAPYSVPFQLRTVMAASAIRSDTSFGAYQNAAAQGGFAVVSALAGAFRIPGTGAAPGTGLAPYAKVTVVGDSAPGTATGGFAFVNPLLGLMYGLSFGSGWRASASLGVTLPVGMGGGDTPNKGALDARTVGPIVRADMDNSLFAVNDVAVVPGLDLAYVAHGFTAQLEATLFQLERVRGEAAQPEASKTNLTTGIHAGYFVLDCLSLGAELRYQRWLNAPIAVDQYKPGTSFDMLSFGVGPRLHIHVAGDIWVRPGIAYTRGFDHPMTSPGNYNIVQLDVPVVF